jgi:hypothetical protein
MRKMRELWRENVGQNERKRGCRLAIRRKNRRDLGNKEEMDWTKRMREDRKREIVVSPTGNKGGERKQRKMKKHYPNGREGGKMYRLAINVR